ncbi:MAG: hypothetical protein SFV15_09665 [Polyangiaceae bacterium]|nr:hypothetical protein [Polyangiaceae bacterium]
MTELAHSTNSSWAIVATLSSLCALLACGSAPQSLATIGSVAVARDPVFPNQQASTLRFEELFEVGPALVPSAKVLALAGKRVRVLGFMVDMELPPKSGFFLTSRPVRCDEGGQGTADLPIASVFVISQSMAGHSVPHVPGRLQVTGILEVGNQPDSSGRVSSFRLRL